ncbi:hypothetical protein ACFLU4_08310 [Chloroflexota bacterium]
MNTHRWVKVISLLVMVLLLSVSTIQPTPVSAAESPPVFLTKWGSEGSGDGQFDNPKGVAVDASGNVYVTDSGNHRIQKFDSSGNFITKWGSQGSGDGQFDWPKGVAVDASGNVYVVESGRIQKFDGDGNFITKWGSYGSGDGEFDELYGVAIDASGNVYVPDLFRIQKFDGDGNFITKWGSYGSGDGELDKLTGVAIDASGNVYVVDNGNHRIQKFDSVGNFITKWGSQGSGDGQFSRPYGVGVDTSGNVYVTDLIDNRIQKFDSDGNYLTKWGSPGALDGEFNLPTGVAVDASRNVCVADRNNRIQVFKPFLQVATSAADDVAATSAILNGNLALGSVATVNVSFEYGLDTNYGNTSTVQAVTNIGSFGLEVEGLLPETTYHYRAKAEGDGIVYGEDMTFNTLVLQPPVVTTGPPLLSGILSSLGSAVSVDVSFEYGLTSAYGSNTAVHTMTSPGTFSISTDGFSPATTYHIRVKAVGDTTSYGPDILTGGEGSTVPGDANDDGEVNALDITKVERLVAGLD